MKTRIAVLTTTRADYGILKNLILELEESKIFDLSLVISGTHLSKLHGNTIDEIKLPNNFVKIDILDYRSRKQNPNKVFTNAVSGFESYIGSSRPSAIVVLGDRYEVLGFAWAAYLSLVPIIHIHGGELTFGALDDQVRHCLTKLSYFHFVACEEYKKRVIQLGEHPSRVFNVGALGLDAIKKRQFLNKQELSDAMNFKLKQYFSVTLHPETTSHSGKKEMLNKVFNALLDFKDYQFIFTASNIDKHADEFNKVVKKFCTGKANFRFYESLGSIKYLSLLRHSQGIIGNSSSGILEAPFLKIPTINIGNRQKGRVMTQSVISLDESFTSTELKRAIQAISSDSFIEILRGSKNPFGNGNTAKQMLKILEKGIFKKLSLQPLKKEFFDISYEI
jgi:GDP/UDP-N,N'-diacetylbacillosamine 2-epimerase (hydrolysing)